MFDSTLRDGAQGEGISFSVHDKMNILRALDEIGITYVEAGNPGSNPKDLDFFRKASQLDLKHVKLAAFGSTRRHSSRVEDDRNVVSLLSANTPVVVIFGKSWDFHVTDIIRTHLDENLAMIEETIAYFVEQGKEVLFDAEHFYDGYKHNPEYALKTLEAATRGGAQTLVLCETNGGALPMEVYKITRSVQERFPKSKLGIHTHNDGGMAEANSIMAVEAGAVHVQGTFVGFGERCGNANLSTLIPALETKMQLKALPEGKLELLTGTARCIAEIANVRIPAGMPYVGKSAFAHKGGMHIDGVSKNALSFEHIDPSSIGNERRLLMSEVAGRSMLLQRIQNVSPELTKDSQETKEIIQKLKELEMEGYQFEGAESSFELVIRKQLGKHRPFFELEHFKILGDQPSENQELSSSAMIKIKVDGTEEITAAEGDGPVNALDRALRKAVEVFYPVLKQVSLTDYKVRVLDSRQASAARVRVLIESSDGVNTWTTVGVSTDIIQASWLALVDSIEYRLIQEDKE
ncbi:MAG: citramalate synthase [Spirochaetota bacterium]